MASALHADSLAGTGQPFAVIEFTGLSIATLGGCFDPINFLWICLPFAFHKVAVPTRFERFSRVLCVIGGISFLAGLIGKHWPRHGLLP